MSSSIATVDVGAYGALHQPIRNDLELKYLGAVHACVCVFNIVTMETRAFFLSPALNVVSSPPLPQIDIVAGDVVVVGIPNIIDGTHTHTLNV